MRRVVVFLGTVGLASCGDPAPVQQAAPHWSDVAPAADPVVANAPAPQDRERTGALLDRGADASVAEPSSQPRGGMRLEALSTRGASSSGASTGSTLQILRGSAVSSRTYDETGSATVAAAPVARPPVATDHTIWLSNDDSASLGSAQRAIASVQAGRSIVPREVRPHEVLNYFTFDHAPVAKGALFSVQMSAEQRGDELSLAMSVQGATPTRKPLDLVLLVDRSGSMSSDDRLVLAKRALHRIAEELRDGDTVDLVSFSDDVTIDARSQHVDGDGLSDAINRLTPSGGTNLEAGLEAAYELATTHVRGVSRETRVVLFTDANANLGETDSGALAAIAQAYKDHGVRLTAVGIGSDIDDENLDKLSERGHGAYAFLGSPAVVDRLFGDGLDGLVSTIAHDVQFELTLPKSLAMKRFYGEESSTVKADVQPVDFFAGNHQLFLQDLAVHGSLSPTDPIVLTVHYRDAATDEPATARFASTVAEVLAADPHDVRKARALMSWTDMLLAPSMRCGAPDVAWNERAELVGQDAEIAFVDTLVTKMCPNGPPHVAEAKVRVDSDTPVESVGLDCGAGPEWRALDGGTVARFRAAAGACSVSLAGDRVLKSTIVTTGRDEDFRCTVRSGAVDCG